MAKLLASNVLFFFSSHYNKETKKDLTSSISEFYLPDELISAKQILIEECVQLNLSNEISEYSKRRHITT